MQLGNCKMEIVEENYQVVLKSRPGVNGEPKEENFLYQQCPYPADIKKGEVLVKTLYLSVDPVLRCCMNEESGVAYIQAWKLGEAAHGIGLGIVVETKDESLKCGNIVMSVGLEWPWQLYHVTNADKLTPVDVSAVDGKLSLILSCLSFIGLTSLIAIREKGRIVPGIDKTFVVSGAAGACGSLAGQIARLEGCETVIGICGSEEKCNFLLQELGFDGAVNYKTDNVSDRLKELCPNGVDVYFDNVGGEISDTVIQQMNTGSRVVLCGQISQYNKAVPYPPPMSENINEILAQKNIERERFLVLNYKEQFPAGLAQLAKWLIEGKLQVKETIETGLENTGRAFVNMMRGGNIGKQLVWVSDQ